MSEIAILRQLTAGQSWKFFSLSGLPNLPAEKRPPTMQGCFNRLPVARS